MTTKKIITQACMALFLAIGLPFQLFADSSVGCGLGQIVAKKNSLISATTRSITNATFSSQLFGITSGTSGCSQHSLVMIPQEAVQFATLHQDEIKRDTAQGEGESLAALAHGLGCNDQGYKNLTNQMQDKYDDLFDSKNSELNTLQKLQVSVLSQKEVYSHCNKILI